MLPDSTLVFAVALLGAQSALANDPLQAERFRLEAELQQLTVTIQDRDWMQDHGRATLARFSAEKGWRQCAENEGAVLAQASEGPARLLAEAALERCRDWERILRLALENGAYPYLKEGPSRDDMVTLAELESRDAALARILLWRSGSSASAPPVASTRHADDVLERARLSAPDAREADPPTARPATASSTPASASDEEPVIVVTAMPRGGCRVRLADRTLTDRQLEANAKLWAAQGTPLRVIRPMGADYRCMAKIAWRLGEHGVRLFHFIDPPAAQ